jgi:hypothetical protein
MSKAPSPLLGYNNNVRHKNRVFHIQTEDSGVKHPHIITHLFMDGGRILKSVKKSYAEHVGTDNMADTVRAMMKEQHKSMLIALRDGQFDHVLDPESSPKLEDGKPGPKEGKGAAKEPAAQEGKPEAAAEAPAKEGKPRVPTKAPPALDDKAPEKGASVAAAAQPAASQPAASAGPQRRATQGMLPAAGASTKSASAPPPPRVAASSRRSAPPGPESAPSTTRDQSPPPIEVRTGVDGGLFQQNDLPPPPRTAVKERPGGGAYRGVPETESRPSPSKPASAPPRSNRPQDLPPPPPRQPSRPAPSQQPARTVGGPMPARPGSPPSSRSGGGGSDGRYAPARPAAIFGQARPHQGSIFGEDLISDKSLDEVILSYLADDLEPPPKKR